MLNISTKANPFKPGQKALRLLQALTVLLALLLLYIAFVGIAIDASALRGKIAAKFSASLGREVSFDGPLQLEISAHPRLRAGGLHIANAPGFGGSEFASLREVRLALDLWSLLRLRLQIEELGGSDVLLRLQMHKDGSNNWTFKSSAAAQKSVIVQGKEPAAGKIQFGSLLAHVDIKRVTLKNLQLEFSTANGNSHFFELTTLEAQLPAGQAVKLTLHGKVEKKYPYQLDFIGGLLADLAQPTKPWPVDIALSFMSSRLAINGMVSANSGELEFGLGSENMREFERLLQTRLPDVGVAGFSGNIKYTPGSVALENLNGVMGKTTLAGGLVFDYGAARPTVHGELALPVLDLRPFLSDKPEQQEEPAKSLAQLYQEIAHATFNLQALNDMDAELSLRVGQWLNVPGAVRDAKMQVQLHHGRLSMPLQANVGGVMLSGTASADAHVKPSRFKLALGTHDSSVGNLAGLLLGVPGVEGQLGRFNLSIAARGDQGAKLMQSLEVSLQVQRGQLSYGNAAGGHAVRLSLQNLELTLPAGKPLSGTATGTLLDNTFSATLQGAPLKDLMQQADVPVDFAIQAGSATVRLHALLQPPAENSGTQVRFDLAAPHSSEISSWLGLKAGTDVAVKLQGNFQLNQHSWHLADFKLQLGRSALAADVFRSIVQGKSLLQLQLTGDLIDADELQSLLPEQEESNGDINLAAASSMIDIPILPNGISLADADIAVHIKRIKTASPFAVRDLRFDGRIRDGMLYASPFAANVAETDFSGALVLDLRTQQPSAQLWLAADAMDIGRVLNKLDIAKNLDASLDHLRLYFDLHSSKLGQLLANSAMSANFDGGHLTLHDANSGGKMRIELDSGELASAAGSAVRMDLQGSLDSVPLKIGIQTATAADLLNPSLSIPLKISADTSAATLQLSGIIERPFIHKDAVFALDMHGTRFDSLNPLLKASLPPWGPWSASGKFRLSASGYEVSELLLQVGASKLGGYGKMKTNTVPAQLDIALAAATIQLDDFRFGEWSPDKIKPAAPKQESNEALRKKKIDSRNKAQKLLSREVLQRQNANITVTVAQVLSGKDVLGSGKLEACLKNGRADIGPVVVNTPGGSAMLKLVFEPGEKDIAFDFKSKVKNFDYGVLARRIDKKSEMRGIFSLDVAVSAHAQYLQDLLRYGKGHIDFALWPENLKSGKLDIWAVNALMALLPAIDSSNESKVNCAIGRFTLNDGILRQKKFLIDTTRMRVTGKGEADFTTQKIQLYAQPRAKTPQFFSFAIPVELTGTFDDFSVGVRPADVLEMTVQLATSVVWVPLQSLFGRSVPADGSDVCKDTNN
ncbi:MAG: AsmA family protein [Gallionellaceae bacterium]